MRFQGSSYRSNAESQPSKLLPLHAQYLALGADDQVRTAAYRELFRSALDPDCVDEIRQATNGGFAFGGERFKAELPPYWRGG